MYSNYVQTKKYLLSITKKKCTLITLPIKMQKLGGSANLNIAYIIFVAANNSKIYCSSESHNLNKNHEIYLYTFLAYLSSLVLLFFYVVLRRNSYLLYIRATQYTKHEYNTVIINRIHNSFSSK